MSNFYAQMSPAQFREEEYTTASVCKLKEMAANDIKDLEECLGEDCGYPWDVVFNELLDRVMSAQYLEGMYLEFDGFEFSVSLDYGSHWGDPICKGYSVAEALEDAKAILGEEV